MLPSWSQKCSKPELAYILTGEKASFTKAKEKPAYNKACVTLSDSHADSYDTYEP